MVAVMRRKIQVAFKTLIELLLTVLAIGGIAAGSVMVMDYANKPREAQRAYFKSVGLNTLAEIDAETSRLCSLRQLCSDYRAAIEACATAGEIDRCASIKMGGRPTLECKASGAAIGVPDAAMVGAWQCRGREVRALFGR